ncbi:MAG: gliding motility protein GldL [Muribaculaceae bacterium]|nr:gliding motility protein GldL [Muribaculaceae bacterium]
MGKIKTYKRGLGAFISSEKGQRFFNFAYSIGAAIVIWGALFKILHLPGGNFLLSLGMGTEVFMFMLTAFDKPARDYKWEKVFPVFETGNPEDRPEFKSGSGINVIGGVAGAGIQQGSPALGQTVAPVLSAGPSPAEVMGKVTEATQTYLDRITEMTNELQRLHETTSALNKVSDVLLDSYKAITENSANITESSRGYVAQMEDLNRNIGGLNTIYEIQLKSVASQLDSIDRVNRGIKDIRDMYEKSSSTSARYCEETEKMARYMQQLNGVYEKMITAMTINMYRPMVNPNDIPTPPPAPDQQ